MSDQPTTPAAATPAPAAEPVAPSEQTVPYSRFAQVNETAKAAQKQLQEMQDRLEELESRDKSELERERSKRTQFEQQAAEMATRLERVERSGWIRSAAAVANFEDPDDAVAFISTQAVESAEDAEKAVKALAKRKPKLLREQQPSPQIGQVVHNGVPVPPGGQQPQQPEIDPAAQALLAQVQAAQAAGWTSSPLE